MHTLGEVVFQSTPPSTALNGRLAFAAKEIGVPRHIVLPEIIDYYERLPVPEKTNAISASITFTPSEITSTVQITFTINGYNHSITFNKSTLVHTSPIGILYYNNNSDVLLENSKLDISSYSGQLSLFFILFLLDEVAVSPISLQIAAIEKTISTSLSILTRTYTGILGETLSF